MDGSVPGRAAGSITLALTAATRKSQWAASRIHTGGQFDSQSAATSDAL